MKHEYKLISSEKTIKGSNTKKQRLYEETQEEANRRIEKSISNIESGLTIRFNERQLKELMTKLSRTK